MIEKSGAWYSYDGQRIGQGAENVKRWLLDHPEAATAIEQRIRGTGDPAALLETDMSPSDNE